MANRWRNQFVSSLEKVVVDLFAEVTFGASGAPTIVAANTKGFISVTRNSAGTYTFVFGSAPNSINALDTYVKFLNAHVIFNSGSSAPASPGMYVKANSVSTAGTCSIQIVLNAAGTATDPASGEIGYFSFTLGDSTAP